MESKVSNTIRYAVVGRWKSTGFRIIADYSEDQISIYRSVVLDMFNDMLMIADNTLNSFDTDKYTLHFLFNGLCFACLTLKALCPLSTIQLRSHAQTFLQWLQDVCKQRPNFANNRAMIDLSISIRKITVEYNRQNVHVTDTIVKLENELVEARHAVMTAIDKIIDRGEKLDDLVRKTENLQVSSGNFHVLTRVHRRSNTVLLMIAIGIVTSLVSILVILFILGIF